MVNPVSRDAQRSALGHATALRWRDAANRERKNRMQLFTRLTKVDWSGPLAFSPDGKLFARCGGYEDNAVYVWRTASGQKVKRFAGHEQEVRCLAFSRDGRMIASGSRDTILVWEVLGLR